MEKKLMQIAILGIVSLITLLSPKSTFAHCDGMDGPVVKASQEAFRSEDVNRVLIWVSATNEQEIRSAFEHTLAVRKLSPEAKELADRYFFETLVRIHRAGEGAAYTGLKPAGRDLGPAIPAADKAIEAGNLDELLRLLQEQVQNGTREQFTRVVGLKSFQNDDIDAGRQFVKAYVEFIHYVERLYESASGAAEGHFAEPPEGTHLEAHWPTH